MKRYDSHGFTAIINYFYHPIYLLTLYYIMSSYPYDHNRGRNGHAKTSSSNSYYSEQRYDNNRGDWSSSSTTPYHGASSHAPSLNSQWTPPISTHSDMNISTSNSSSSSTYNNKSRWSKSNSSGQHGGGKAKKRQHKNSNDTKHNQYSRPRPPKKKNIISPDSASGNPQSADNNIANEAIPKLDPNDPANKNKIFQRRKQINFGKNTTGYEEYIKKIPKHKRLKRSAECPMTPDYLLDIPTKRFQGLMNAW